MNAKRSSGESNEPNAADKAVEDLVRASAEAVEVVMNGEWAKNIEAPSVPVHPLMGHPTAMMAAATVVGMGVSGQIAGMWLGFMKGLSEGVEGYPGEPEVSSDAADIAGAPEVERQQPAEKQAIRVVVDNDAAAAAEPQPIAETSEKPVDADQTSVSRDKVAADDLKRISGIGPKLATILAVKGYGGFSAIAAMDSATAKALDDELGLDGRIERDDWPGQARALLEWEAG